MVRLYNHVKEGLLNLYYFKLRSFLAMLGVLVGTASVVAMVLSGELATHEALQQFRSLGTDLLAVSISTTNKEGLESSGRMADLTLQQAQTLMQIDNAIIQIAPYMQLFSSIYYYGHAIDSAVLGVTDNFADILNIHFQSGRFVSLLDRYEPYCVIGRSIYNQMKKISLQEPLGQPLQIGQQIFTIVGVADAWQENSFINVNIDESVMVPLMVATTMDHHASINNVILKLLPNVDVEKVEAKITTFINGLLFGKQLSFRSAKELLAKIAKQSVILMALLGLIGSISLIVGGVGVMNVMLVAMTERRREIGIRLAVGARRYDIGMMFLVESILLSLIGGILGVMLGLLIAYTMALFWHWQFTLFIWPPLIGFSVSVAVGIFFGFYPAYLAAKLDPIEALRAE